MRAMEGFVESLRFYTEADDRESALILAHKIRSHAEKYIAGACTGFVETDVEVREES
jgi:hypothetical protein